MTAPLHVGIPKGHVRKVPAEPARRADGASKSRHTSVGRCTLEPARPAVDNADAPLTDLLQLAARGEPGALDEVFAALYPELRQIAHARLRSQGGVAHLETTALVHESFLRLVEARRLEVSGRKHFFTYAAKTMRNIIVDFAREQLSERRGGGEPTLQLTPTLAGTVPSGDGDVTLIRINDALLELEKVDPLLTQVVEMRYFAGYTEVEIAELLGSSERTVRRQWEKARAFLLVSLQP
jgi:RNA polymerase sigma factor (TIGR02999 family)